MPTVTENMLQGNYAEFLAAHVLSKSCLVRPVVGQTDVGVDLYCESVVDGKLFLHFWVQVKSSQGFPNEKVDASFGFKKPSLRYWEQQPVPTIALLVPIPGPPATTRFLHVVDVTFDILDQGIGEGDGEQTLRSKTDLILPLDDSGKLDAALTNLLLHHLPMVVSAMYAKKGFFYPAPKPGPELVKYFSGHFLHRYLPQIDKGICEAATFATKQYLAAGGPPEAIPHAILAVLETLKDSPHYSVQETLGTLALARGNREEARAYFASAVRALKALFVAVPRKPPLTDELARIEAILQSLSDDGSS